MIRRLLWLIAVAIIPWAILAKSPSPATAQTAAQATPTPLGTRPVPLATPTIDRLAPPPTAENPSQADEGAQLYWLHCQPCHGDQGQGLTEDWRAQYPPEDQNCWESGCHGERPYESGFRLPDSVPALTGAGSLDRFNTLADVFSYMRAAMPYQDPGHLSDEEYLAITAFLADAHKIWDGRRLDAQNARLLRLRPEGNPSSDLATKALTLGEPPTAAVPGGEGGISAGASRTLKVTLLGGALALFSVAGGAWLWRRNKG